MTVDTLTLQAVPDSVPQARRFIRRCVHALGADGACDDAETLVSELATNAVLHAKTDYTITISRTNGTILVRVFDLNSVLPRRRRYGPDSTTGRGILLVADLSTRWGVEAEGSGKVIWFELSVNGTPAGSDPLDDIDIDIDVDELLAAFDEPTDLGSAAPPQARAA